MTESGEHAEKKHRGLFRRRAAHNELNEELSADFGLDLSEHLEGIRDALAAFIDGARHAGLDAPVPTCPDWTVRQLIAHQGMVHRWATAELRGEKSNPSMQEGLEVKDPITWLHDGGLTLVETLDSVPDDVEALVFLNDAPPPRSFWARRQCHETTIHAIDALASSLGRPVRAEDTWISREIALDGIDELLTGFVTRKRSPLRAETPTTFVVRPRDAGMRWTVNVSSEPAVTERRDHEHADVVLEGSAVALYLALWNRSEEIQADGFDLWRSTACITWD
jgi:uncharacterized protein (TIGR03083 family)